MCQNTTPRSVPKNTISGRVCRWMVPAAQALSMLIEGSPCPLMIKVVRKGGKEFSAYYWVTKTDAGWQLLKEDVKGRFSETYHIDTTFDEDPGTWTCDCYDATHYGQQCKHKFALIAALKRVGYLKP